MSFELQFWHLLLVFPTLAIPFVGIHYHRVIWQRRTMYTGWIIALGCLVSVSTAVVIYPKQTASSPVMSAQWAAVYNSLQGSTYHETTAQALRAFVAKHPDKKPSITPKGMNMFLKLVANSTDKFHEVSNLIFPYLDVCTCETEENGETK